MTMNLSLARDTVVRVERSVAGQVGQLPANTTIREAAHFLRLHARTDTPERLIDGIINGGPITISAGLTDALRSLLLAAEARAAADAPPVAELSDVPPGQDLSYVPNQIPARVRRAHIVTSLGLLAYGAFGLRHDDLYIRWKRSSGTHFHGWPLWLVLAAMVCAAANLLAVVIDHYDRRENERSYRIFAKASQVLGWGFLGLAIVLDLLMRLWNLLITLWRWT